MSARPLELARDAYRNLGWPHALIGLASVLALVGMNLLVLGQMSASLRQEVDLRRSGTLVWTAVLDEESQVEAAVCRRLAGAGGVHAAGGVIRPGTLPHLTAYPGGQPVPVTHVTPGYVAVFVPQSPPSAVTVGPALLDLGAVSTGQALYDGVQPLARIDTVLPEWVPSQVLGSTVAVPGTGEQLLHECAVRMAPGAEDAGGDLLQSALGNQARISRFATPTGATDTPWAQWETALQWQPAIVAGAIIGLVGLVVQWSRRSEYGVRRVFGSRAAELLTLAALESVLTLLPAAGLSIVTVWSFMLVSPDPIPEVAASLTVFTVTAGIGIAWPLVSAAALLMSRGNPWARLRDR